MYYISVHNVTYVYDNVFGLWISSAVLIVCSRKGCYVCFLRDESLPSVIHFILYEIVYVYVFISGER